MLVLVILQFFKFINQCKFICVNLVHTIFNKSPFIWWNLRDFFSLFAASIGYPRVGENELNEVFFLSIFAQHRSMRKVLQQQNNHGDGIQHILLN